MFTVRAEPTSPRGTVFTAMTPGGAAGRNRSVAVRNASGPNGTGIVFRLLIPSELSSNTKNADDARPTAQQRAVVALITSVPLNESTSFCAPRSPQNSLNRTTEIEA